MSERDTKLELIDDVDGMTYRDVLVDLCLSRARVLTSAGRSSILLERVELRPDAWSTRSSPPTPGASSRARAKPRGRTRPGGALKSARQDPAKGSFKNRAAGPGIKAFQKVRGRTQGKPLDKPVAPAYVRVDE